MFRVTKIISFVQWQLCWITSDFVLTMHLISIRPIALRRTKSLKLLLKRLLHLLLFRARYTLMIRKSLSLRNSVLIMNLLRILNLRHLVLMNSRQMNMLSICMICMELHILVLRHSQRWVIMLKSMNMFRSQLLQHPISSRKISSI